MVKEQDIAGNLVTDKRAWRGADLANTSWKTQLSAEFLAELNQLAHALPAADPDWLKFDYAQNMSASFADELHKAGAELSYGKGFVLLRGLNAEDPELFRRAFWIIGNGLGTPVMQNARGEVLSKIEDRFAGAERGVDTRGYESNDELRFHCDGGDSIGMSCVHQATRGGTNGLVSLFAIYNEILSHHPEYLDVLMQGYPLYARKEKGDEGSVKNLGKVQQRRIPVFAWHEGRMSTWLNIQLAELAAQVSAQAFSEIERGALACVEEIANRPDMQLTFKQEPGDVIFVNNLAVMHRREKYYDPVDGGNKRMLYRMWINLHQAGNRAAPHAGLRRGIRGPNPVIAAA